ncbi:MAG: hypothetical protein ABH867_03975 [Patescibacteria group bacterium]|nr:hypothetical protein [Patescibacteria group bacterium]
MKLKKGFAILLPVLLIDVLTCLLINADLIGIQKKYFQLESRIDQLISANQILEKETADSSSISKISQTAKSVGLEPNKRSIVFVYPDQFANR